MLNNDLPLLSIAITSYNHEKFISHAINSILFQNYPNIEIIISDDASNDNTLQIIKKYAQSHPGKIKLLIAEQNGGAAENWFKCVQECRGKYVIGLGGDDEFLSGILSEQVKIMEQDENIAICYSDAAVFDVHAQKVLYHLSDKAPTKSGGVEVALQDGIYYSPTMMFRRNLVPPNNTFVKIRHGSDLAFYKELMILSAPNGKIQYLPKILYKYQKHDKNITVTDNSYRREHIECVKILQRKYPNYKELLAPAIYDFCCVALFKSVLKLESRDIYYFLVTGLKASKNNPFKFLRSTIWVVKFVFRYFYKILFSCKKFSR